MTRLLKNWRLSKEVVETVLVEAKYEGYLNRQEHQIAAFRKLENIKLSDNLDYHVIPHLRFEAKEKFLSVSSRHAGAGRTYRRHHPGGHYRYSNLSEKD